MKNILFLLCILFYGHSLIAQIDKKWLVSMDIGVQAHDKRLNQWPELLVQELLESQPKAFGVSQFGASLSRLIINHKRLRLYAGMGLSVEMASFRRPFKHIYPNTVGDKRLLFTNRYYKNILQIPIQMKYSLSKKISITLGALPQINFLTIAAQKTRENFTWKEFNLHSVELNPGIEYNKGRFVYGLKYRLFQVRKIDPILFFSTSDYSMGDEKYEIYNPFKLWFSMGYEF